MMTALAAIETHFESVEDPRDPDLIDHLLLEMIVVTICAVICGAENWVDVANWGNARREWLRQYIKLEKGIASHDTFRRVFLAIDPAQFQAGFQGWIEAVFDLSQGEVVAIDGKQLRGSRRQAGSRAAICMVSAWSTANQLVLGQRKTEDKSNEISAIPELLRLLQLKGSIVTIDAAGCQKENARLIVKQKADYLLSLKQNQESLYNDVVFMFERAFAQDFVSIDADYVADVSGGHGRIETRHCWAIDDEAVLAFLRDRSLWLGLTSIVMIRSIRRSGGQETSQDTYYISSLACDARRILKAKRDHWQVENNLHWVLDVAFDEDRHQLSGNGAANMAVVRHMALGLLKQEEND